jgi:hypothetical protein
MTTPNKNAAETHTPVISPPLRIVNSHTRRGRVAVNPRRSQIATPQVCTPPPISSEMVPSLSARQTNPDLQE